MQFIVKEAFGLIWELNLRSVDTRPFKTCFLEALPDGNSDVPDDNLVALDGRYAGDVHDKGPVHSEKLIDNQFFFCAEKSESHMELMAMDYHVPDDAEWDCIALILGYDHYFFNNTLRLSHISVH